MISRVSNNWIDDIGISFAMHCDTNILNRSQREEIADELHSTLWYAIEDETPGYWDEDKYGTWAG